MGFESFYGGRIGASFVIVKRFDGIDIPQVAGQEVYKTKYLATTNDRQYLLYDNGFIERTADNYTDYNWQIQAMDGSTVGTKTDKEGLSPVVSEVLDIMPAEGMRQCFEQGGNTTNIVNYGEYVIIDNNVRSNPDNGKVYRRGMNFDYNPDTNPLAGAEYIGQIIGPKGDIAEVKLEHYEDVIQTSGHSEISYAEASGDLVPGSYEDGTGIRIFNDTIEWSQATFRNKYGDIIGCIIGFKIPTLVDDFEATSMSPYEQRKVNPSTGKYENYDLISEDSNEYIDGKWQHPFYQKWQIKIPSGYHGVNSTNLEIVHTKTMPSGYKINFSGTLVYDDIACTVPHYNSGSPVPLVLSNSVDVLREAEDVVYQQSDAPIYDTDDSVISCKINYNDQTLYVKKEDCYMDIVRYRETNFDNVEVGELTYHDIGYFNTIQRIDLATDGTLTVYYSGTTQPYNINKALTWITDVSLNQQGDFIVLYNNDNIEPNGRYYQSLEWIDYVTVDPDGTMTFYYNNNHTNPAYQFTKLIETIKDIEIQTESSAGAGEGTGDQRVHVEFNTGRLEVIGKPLNYIIETVISKPSTAYPNAPFSHLLVYYADPALRQALQSRWVTYPSEKTPGTVWTEWVDLGDVRGSAGGLHILEDVDSLTDLQDGSGNWIPPEQLTDSGGTILDPDAAGWAVTYTPSGSSTSTVYCYDYNAKVWYPIGAIDPGLVEPKHVIVKSAPVGNTEMPDPVDVSLLNENGFWLATEVMYYAQ